jgi:hypothetical protein
MTIVESLIGEGISKPIEAIGNVLDRLFTSDDEKAQAKIVLEKLQQHPAELQVELNKIEASQRSLFIAGWRPFIGWICGVGLSFAFVINPLIQWFTGKPGPELPLTVIMNLVIALLGLGGLRTYEKVKGISK